MSSQFTLAVFRWRTIACCIWMVLITLPSLMAFQLLYETLMWQSWSVVPSLRSAGFLIGYLAVMVAIISLYSTTYTAKLPVFKTRLDALWNVLCPEHFLGILGLSVVGALCSWCLTEFLGYSSGLWRTCELYRVKTKCLNEDVWFNTAFGAFNGFWYGCGYFFNKEYFLVFPSLQENKLFRLRGHFWSHVWEGLVWTLTVLRVYYPFYYIFGSSLQFYVTNLMHLHPPEEASLDRLSGFLNLSLLLHLVLTSCFVHMSWSFALRLFRTYQTQAVPFPVVATFSQDNERLLGVALTSDFLLLKLLGFLDLCQLSLHSPQRRKQVFSLSTAGQPQVWSDVCDQCLQVVRSLIERLTAGKGTAALPPALDKPSLSDRQFPHYTPTGTKGWPSLATDETPGATRRHVFNEKARLWSYSPGHSIERIPTLRTKETPSPAKLAIQRVRCYILSIPKKLKEWLKRKPFFKHFLNELPDTTNQELFADCQLQVWAVTSISELAVASYAEDTYGVVQRSLAVIIESLIDLSQALDKHVKAPLSSSKSTRNIRVALEANGRYAVKTAVQTALFRLATTFSKERRSIQLSPGHHQYWSKYYVA